MNKYYNINESRKSNCSYIGRCESEQDSVVDSIIAMVCAIVALIRSDAFISVSRVVSTVACFVGFVGIIGGIEAGMLTVGHGIILAMFLVAIEVACFIPKKESK